MTPATRPRTAMLLAAGRGKRMRALTETLPKPLIAVAGKPLIDHGLDALAAARVARAVVNLWHHADMLAAHLAARERPAIELLRERELLETGGGVANALPRLGADAFFVVNSDVLWREAGRPALDRLAEAWRDEAMDALLLVVPRARAVGYDGRGDFDLDPRGQRLSRRAASGEAGHVFTGIQILHPRLFAGAPEGAFSLNLLYDRALAAGRLRGIEHAGEWFHVGTPEGRDEAERRLGPAAAG